MLNRVCLLAILAWCTALAAVDVHDLTITGTSTYSDTIVNIWNDVVAAPSGNLAVTIPSEPTNGTNGIHVQCGTLATSVQYGAVTHLAVANQPPVIAWIGSNAVAGHLTGTSVILSAIGADDGGPAGLSFTWSGSGSGTVSWPSGNTGATCTAGVNNAGSYTFTVSAIDQAGLPGTASITVVFDQTCSALAINPNPVTTSNTTYNFSGHTAAADQFGHTMSLPQLNWTISSGFGSIDASTGLFTASAVGTTVVAVKLLSNPAVQTTGTITVSAAYHIDVSPTVESVVVTQQTAQPFVATMKDQFNAPATSQPAFAWSLQPGAGGLTNTTTRQTDVIASAVAGGSYAVTASTAGYPSGSATIQLIVPPMIYVDNHSYPGAPILTSTQTWLWNGTYTINNMAVGHGWIVSDAGTPSFQPDKVNFAGTSAVEYMAFIATDGLIYFASNDITGGGRINPIVKSGILGPGWISGHANLLQFEYDRSAGARTYYAYFDSILKPGQWGGGSYPANLDTEIKGLWFGTQSLAFNEAAVGYGYANFTNRGKTQYGPLGSGNGVTSGYFPSFAFSITPHNYQNWSVSNQTVGWWDGAQYVWGSLVTATPIVSQGFYSMTQATGGNAAFSIQYDSTAYIQSIAAASYTSGVSVFDLWVGSLAFQQVVPQ